MIRVPRWIRALAPILAFALIAVLAGPRPGMALARELVRQADLGVSSVPAGLPAGVDMAQVRGNAPYTTRKLSDSRLARTRRCQGTGFQGLLAPGPETPACLITPEAPLQLEPPAACIQDRLDLCTRSPRPPPQV